jgi:hypothetical protein
MTDAALELMVMDDGTAPALHSLRKLIIGGRLRGRGAPKHGMIRGVTSRGIEALAGYLEGANEVARECAQRYGGGGGGGGQYKPDHTYDADPQFNRLNDAGTPLDNAQLPVHRSPSATVHRSPSATVHRSPSATVHRSPSATVHRSPSATPSRRQFVGLEHVEMSGCDRVSAKALIQLVRSSPRLRHLDCRDCAVGDKFVRALLGLPPTELTSVQGVKGQSVAEVEKQLDSVSADDAAEDADGDAAAAPLACGLSLRRLLLSSRRLTVHMEALLKRSRPQLELLVEGDRAL